MESAEQYCHVQAAPGAGVGRQLRAMCFGDGLHDDQAQSVAVGVVGSLGTESLERLEKPS